MFNEQLSSVGNQTLENNPESEKKRVISFIEFSQLFDNKVYSSLDEISGILDKYDFINISQSLYPINLGDDMFSPGECEKVNGEFLVYADFLKAKVQEILEGKCPVWPKDGDKTVLQQFPQFLRTLYNTAKNNGWEEIKNDSGEIYLRKIGANAEAPEKPTSEPEKPVEYFDRINPQEWSDYKEHWKQNLYDELVELAQVNSPDAICELSIKISGRETDILEALRGYREKNIDPSWLEAEEKAIKDECEEARAKVERIADVVGKISSCDSFDDLYRIFEDEAVPAAEAIGWKTLSLNRDEIEAVRKGEKSFWVAGKRVLPWNGAFTLYKKVSELLKEEGIDTEDQYSEDERTIDEIELKFDKIMNASDDTALEKARQDLCEFSQNPKHKDVLEAKRKKLQDWLDDRRSELAINPGDEEAQKAVKNLEAKINEIDGVLLRGPEAPEAEKETPENTDLAESIENGFWEYFSITPEDLETVYGYKELPESKKLLVYENLRQIMLGKIQDEAETQTGEALSRSKLPGRIWRNVWKNYYTAKGEKEALRNMASGGIGVHGAMLEDLVRQIHESKIEVEVEKKGESFKPTIDFVGKAYGETNDAEKIAIKEFNTAAREFTAIPQEWSSKYASRRNRLKYEKALEKYDATKAELLSQEEARTGSEAEAVINVSEIDRMVRLNQFLTANPEVGEALDKIGSKSAWLRSLGGVGLERGAYAAAGFGLRTATMSMIGLAGLPIAAAAMSGMMAWRRGKEALKTGEKKARTGANQEGLERARADRLSAFKEYLGILSEKDSGTSSSEIEEAKARVQDARASAELEFERAKLEFEAGELKIEPNLEEFWQKRLGENPLLAEAVQKVEDASEDAKRKMDSALLRLREEEAKILEKGGKIYESAEDLTKKIDTLYRTLWNERSVGGKPMTDSERQNLIRRLKLRLEYTQEKIDNGQVLFGADSRNRLWKIDKLLETMGSASVIAARETVGEPAMVRAREELEKFQDKKLTKEEERERKILLKQVVRGAAYGAVFSATGWAVRHFFAGDISAINESGKATIEDAETYRNNANADSVLVEDNQQPVPTPTPEDTVAKPAPAPRLEAETPVVKPKPPVENATNSPRGTSAERTATGNTPERNANASAREEAVVTTARPKVLGVNYLESARSSVTEKFTTPELVQGEEGISHAVYRELANKVIDDREFRTRLGLGDDWQSEPNRVKALLNREMLRVIRESEVVDNTGKSLGKALNSDGSEIRFRNLANVEEKVIIRPDGKIEITGSTYQWTKPAPEVPVQSSSREESLREAVNAAHAVERVGNIPAREVIKPSYEEIQSQRGQELPDSSASARNLQSSGARSGEGITENSDRSEVPAGDGSEPVVRETTTNSVTTNPETGEIRVNYGREGSRGGSNSEVPVETQRASAELLRELVEKHQFRDYFKFFGGSGRDRGDVLSKTAALARTFNLNPSESRGFAYFISEGGELGNAKIDDYFPEGVFNHESFARATRSFVDELNNRHTFPRGAGETAGGVAEGRWLNIPGRGRVIGIVKNTGGNDGGQYEYIVEGMNKPKAIGQSGLINMGLRARE